MPPAKRKPPVKPSSGTAVSVDEPLEFLRANTYQLRQVCLTIEGFVAGEAPADKVIAACQYLSVEYPLHLFDVTDDLAPLLQDRCKPSDNIAPVLEELVETQKTVRVLAAKTVKVLVAQLEQRSDGGPTRSAQRQARELLVVLRRLSAIESGIILPLAGVRLSAVDLADLSCRLKRRRGLADPS
ncbi:MAG: hypothetical protein EP345_18455 [Sphingomonadales bacterium]|nr:MAG: hypothetical protein EP345_18455 [Sphingomonadales bacterium]